MLESTYTCCCMEIKKKDILSSKFLQTEYYSSKLCDIQKNYTQKLVTFGNIQNTRD